MNTLSDRLPQTCQTCHSLATSIVFGLPFARQIWWWLDIRPATRKRFNGLLQDGKTVCLNPGGIQECLYMRPGHEVAYLTQRLGFIRIAIRHGYAHPPSDLWSCGEIFFISGKCVCAVPRLFLRSLLGSLTCTSTSGQGHRSSQRVPLQHLVERLDLCRFCSGGAGAPLSLTIRQ